MKYMWYYNAYFQNIFFTLLNANRCIENFKAIDDIVICLALSLSIYIKKTTFYQLWTVRWNLQRFVLTNQQAYHN